MKRGLRLVMDLCTLVSAAILVLVPLLMSFDFGGMLWWTQSVAALAIGLAMVLGLPGIFDRENPRQLGKRLFLVPLVIWLLYALFQVVPMPEWLVRSLSGGSFAAYTQWISPLLPSGESPAKFPISLSAEQSLHSISVLGLVLSAAWAASHVFLSRWRVGLLLNLIVLGVATHSVFGIVRLSFPEIDLFGVEASNSGFGAFLNRNNAALMLNTGIACSLGLLSWRLSALTGLEVDAPEFEFNDVIALASDRDSMIGYIGLICCTIGLLVCGSRGGLVAGTCASLLALGWMRQARGLKNVLVIAVALVFSILILMVPLNLDLTSLYRMEFFADGGANALAQDGRLRHWQDGWQAAVAYLPLGSGLGTYGYAYLPFQNQSSAGWHVHADNLWLELFVEQGILGIVLTIALFAMVIGALQRLHSSSDAMDHGLRILGWYLLGAIGVSQFFDFGLIVPSNLFLVSILLPVVIIRSHLGSAGDGKTIRFHTWSQTTACLVIAAVVGGLTYFSAKRLVVDSQVERLDLVVTNSLAVIKANPSRLEALDRQIMSHPRYAASPRLQGASSSVKNRIAKLVEVRLMNPSSETELRTAYRLAGTLSHRRSIYPQLKQDVPPLDATAAESYLQRSKSNEKLLMIYHELLGLATQTLKTQPLDLRARTQQLQLDFVHGDPERRLAAFHQIHRIHLQNPTTLYELGSYAAGIGEFGLARENWMESVRLRPSFVDRLIQDVALHSQLDLVDVLPDDRHVFRQVARKIVNDETPSLNLLIRSREEIDCEHCITREEKFACIELAGDIEFALGNFAEAMTKYELAVSLHPTNVNLNLKFIRRLSSSGYRREALMAARRARMVIPSDSRFTRLIEQMASEDLEQIENQKNKETDSK